MKTRKIQFAPARLGPIGLTIGSRYIAAAQLAHGRGLPRLHAAAWIEREQVGDRWPSQTRLSARESEVLAGALARQGFAGSRVTLAVGSGDAPTTMLELPPRVSGAPLEQIAATEIARVQRLEPGSFEVAMWDLPSPGNRANGTTALAVACPHVLAEEILAPFDAQGLVVESLDAGCRCLARALEGLLPTPGAAPTLSAIAHVAWESTQVVVVWTPSAADPSASRHVVYERAIGEIGLWSAYASLRDRHHLGVHAVDGARAELRGIEIMTPDEASGTRSVRGAIAEVRRAFDEFLARVGAETQRSLSYAARRFPTATQGEVLASGEGALLPWCAARLQAGIGVPVRVAELGQVVQVTESLEAFRLSPTLIAAAGAALLDVPDANKEAA